MAWTGGGGRGCAARPSAAAADLDKLSEQCTCAKHMLEQACKAAFSLHQPKGIHPFTSAIDGRSLGRPGPAAVHPASRCSCHRDPALHWLVAPSGPRLWHCLLMGSCNLWRRRSALVEQHFCIVACLK